MTTTKRFEREQMSSPRGKLYDIAVSRNDQDLVRYAVNPETPISDIRRRLTAVATLEQSSAA